MPDKNVKFIIYFYNTVCASLLFYSVICGLTEETTKNHVVKAALEAVCFQTTDIIEAMNKDCGGAPLTKLLVDGGMAANNYLMQLQADLSGVPVSRY